MLTEDQKRLMRQKLLEKYQSAQDNSGVEAAQESADNTDLISGIGQALSKIATADSVSRGGQGPDLSMYQGMRDRAKQAIQQAVEARQGKIAAAKGEMDMQHGFNAEDRADAGLQLNQDQFANTKEQQGIQNTLDRDRLQQSAMDRAQARADSAANRADAREAREHEREIRRQDKQDLRHDLVNVPGLGEANNPEDAKQLKSAVELKTSFDNKINEMIDLRKKHEGGALFAREDVARGKQLSNDLLLLYKDMSKLGVLSAKDTEILNAIIPRDPLEYDFAPGDPVLHRLQKFKGDMQSDYDTRLKTRLKPAPAANIDAEIDALEKELGLK